MNGAIWAFAECADGQVRTDSLEAVGEAVALAKTFETQAHALLVGSGTDEAADSVRMQGVSMLHVAEDSRLAQFDSGLFAQVLENAIEAYKPAVLLLAQSPNGTALAPLIAAKIDGVFLPNLVSLGLSDSGDLEAVQSIYDGKVYRRTAVPTSKPLIGSFVPDSIGVGPDVQASCEEQTVDVDGLAQTAVQVLGFEPADPETVAIEDAVMVVAGGLGYGSKEGFDCLWSLSKALGAAVGGSKPTFDNGWIPRERFIGQSSGRKLASKLVLATGVSGSSYFLGGMKAAQCVIAVNKDKGAPIMKEADLAVVGDVAEVVPALTQALLERKGEVDS